MDELSIICIFNGEKEYIPLIHYNYNLIKSDYKSELIIIDFGNEDLSSHFLNEEERWQVVSYVMKLKGDLEK